MYGSSVVRRLTLDVYGHGLDWKQSVAAAREAGLAIREAVLEAEKSDRFVSLTAVNENGSQIAEIGSR